MERFRPTTIMQAGLEKKQRVLAKKFYALGILVFKVFGGFLGLLVLPSVQRRPQTQKLRPRKNILFTFLPVM